MRVHRGRPAPGCSSSRAHPCRETPRRAPSLYSRRRRRARPDRPSEIRRVELSRRHDSTTDWHVRDCCTTFRERTSRRTSSKPGSPLLTCTCPRSHDLGLDQDSAIAVEDSRVGVQAAVAAGLRVYWYQPSFVGTNCWVGSVRLFGQMSALPAMLAEDLPHNAHRRQPLMVGLVIADGRRGRSATGIGSIEI